MTPFTGSHFVSHAYRKRCLRLHRQQNRYRRNPGRAPSRFSAVPLPPSSRSSRRPLRAERLSSPPCRRSVPYLGWFHTEREGGRGRKGRSLIIITFTPFIISKHHHHHQRDEACLPSLETHRNTQPASAPDKMHRADRPPSPDGVWCSTFYYLFFDLEISWLCWKSERASEHCGLASSWMNDADFTSSLI